MKMPNYLLVLAMASTLAMTAADATAPAPPAAKTSSVVQPVLAQNLAYAPGRIGLALKVSESVRLQYPETVMTLAGGTVEVWVYLDEQIPAGKQVFLVSNGTNNPSWMFWGFETANTNFLARSRKDAKNFSYYSSIKIPFTTPAKQWTHFALVWCNIAPGESLVQLYVNGKVVIERFDQSLGEATAGPIGIGHNTATISTPAFSGALDELRISNCPRSPEEILADYQAGLSGKALSADDKTLLYAAFEESADGLANAMPLTLEKLKEQGEVLLDELVEQ